MANNQEFLTEINTHLASLQEGVDQISGVVATNNREIASARAERKAVIHSTVVSALPNLEPSTLESLNSLLPGIIDASAIDQNRTQLENSIRIQLQRVKGRNDPEMYEATRSRLSAEAAQERESLSQASSIKDSYDGVPGLEDLIESGYGTVSYMVSWYQPRFYRDWKNADQVVESTNSKDWDALRNAYTRTANDVYQHRTNLNNLQSELETLNADHNAYLDLQAELQRVPSRVLDSLRVKVEAHLDGLLPVPTFLVGVEALNSKITTLGAENVKLQTTYGKLTTEISQLNSVKVKVSRSRKPIPEQYLTSLRSRRPSTVVYQVNSPTVFYDNYSNGFYDGLIWDEMFQSIAYSEPSYQSGGYSIPSSYSYSSGGGSSYTPNDSQVTS